MSEDQELEADLSSFFSMLAIINVTAQPFSKLFETKYDITLNEWRILHILALNPGCSQAAIVRALGLDKMTVSRAVARLKRKGSISKVADPENLRAARMSMTAAGRRLHKLIATSGARRAKHLFVGFSAEERRMHRNLIARMLANAQRMDGQSSD
ncbi:MAG: MarR family transcriptional regulator [Hyphomonadaceae bacterium]|nr:MarR family transcriptional regulator [Hyphomonadaceae bacterium]